MTEPSAIVLVPPQPQLAAGLAAALPGVPVLNLETARGAEAAGVPQGAAGTDPGLPPGPPILFVDWLLPDGSGIELCRRLREEGAFAAAPIIIVFDVADREMFRRALQHGADDYLVGPLTVEAVRRQCRFAVRGAAGRGAAPPAPPGDAAASATATAGAGLPIEVDVAAGLARAGGKPLSLSPVEFRLLACLVERRNRVQSRDELIRAVGRQPFAVDDRTVDVWIGRLRRAMRSAGLPDPIRTVRAAGYVLDS